MKLWRGKMRKALLVHLLLCPFESRPVTKSAALKAEPSSADHHGFVASKSRCGLRETQTPLGHRAAPASFGAGVQLQASWGQAAGGVGVLCPVCSSAFLALDHEYLHSGLTCSCPSRIIPSHRSLKLLRSLPAVVDEIKLIKSREALSMCQ